MSFHWDTGATLPTDWITFGQGVYRNIFYTDETVILPVVRGGGARLAGWQIIDHTGMTAATGGSVAVGAAWSPPAGLPCGWYRVLFTAGTPATGWHLNRGGGTFIITRRHPGAPPRPPLTVPGVATGGVQDASLAFAMGIGARIDMTSTNPDVDQSGIPEAIRQYQAYSWASDTARPRPLLINHDGDANQPTNQANITALAAAHPQITHWESANEPNGVPGAWFVDFQRNFYTAVKAGRPDAVVTGPCPVTIGGDSVGQLEAFLAAGGGDWIDTYSFHAYNAHMGDLVTGRRVFDGFIGLLAKYGQDRKPRMNSESGGQFGAEYGAGQWFRQAQRNMLDLFLHEQYGVPKESWNYFYSASHGFWDYPSFLEDGQGAVVYPTVALLLTHTQQLYGTAFEARLDFGTIDNDTLIGSAHRRADGTGVVALLAAGRETSPITLRIAGGSPGQLAATDGWGRTSTVPVAGGVANLTLGTAPLYLALPAGVTATPVERRLGTNFAATAAATVSGGQYRLSDPNQVIRGPWRNSLYYSAGNSGDGRSVFNSNVPPTPAAPVLFTVTLTAPTPVDAVLVHCPPAWQANLSVIRDADLQVRVGGAWQTVRTFGYTPRIEAIDSDPNTGPNAFFEAWDDDVHAFELTFPRVTATGVRLVVREITAGGTQTSEALAAFGATNTAGQPLQAGMGASPVDQRLALQRIAVFATEGSIRGTGKYVCRRAVG